MRQAINVVEHFEDVLKGMTARIVPLDIAEQSCPLEAPAFAIAYSGGLDSSVLLHLAACYAVKHGIKICAFHVHHGISLNADQWLEHCKSVCASLNIVFDVRWIQLDKADKTGIEEAARISRYAALGDMCRQHHVPLLLTAHHQDDQAETVLLQLLRGSGVAGLSGMEMFNTAPDLLRDAKLLMARPLLMVSRAALESYMANHHITYIEDESNHDQRYARNALRHQLMPVLKRYFPGFEERFSRTAKHMQAGQKLLTELAMQDMVVCADGECIDLNQLSRLTSERIDNLLRYWFVLHGLRMPSRAWLREMRQQLLSAKADAQLCVTHPDCHIRRHRNRVYLTPRDDNNCYKAEPHQFYWNGETEIRFSEYGGTLYFDTLVQGVDAVWLRSQPLQLGYRHGGERLKLAYNRPTKALKYHYQACDVPAWERERLPLVSTAGKLLFAAGIGMDYRHFALSPGPHIGFRWQADKLILKKKIPVGIT